MRRDADDHEQVGLIRVREHCLFIWRGPAPEGWRASDAPPRWIEALENHCQPCVAKVTLHLGFGIIDRRAGRRWGDR